MDYSLVLAAALIGLSFQNSFACVFLTMSASAGQGIRAGIGFVLGRLVGVLVLGSAFALVGSMIEIDVRTMLYIFGGLTIAMGALLLMDPPFLKRIGLAQGCKGGRCSECGDVPPEEEGGHDCARCPSEEGCTGKRRGSRLGRYGLFAVGLVRGATPCLKVMLLVPLLVTLPFLQGAALTATYALTSSIYPIAGIALASIVSDLSPRRWGSWMAKGGALAMVLIGTYFLYKAYTYSCPG